MGPPMTFMLDGNSTSLFSEDRLKPQASDAEAVVEEDAATQLLRRELYLSRAQAHRLRRHSRRRCSCWCWMGDRCLRLPLLRQDPAASDVSTK
jgi:hypothetical protein